MAMCSIVLTNGLPISIPETFGHHAPNCRRFHHHLPIAQQPPFPKQTSRFQNDRNPRLIDHRSLLDSSLSAPQAEHGALVQLQDPLLRLRSQ
jgi:hypothetical protein